MNYNISIILRWVHSHDKSDGNNYVDLAAKAASEIVTFTEINPNNMLSLKTMKNMISYKALMYDEENWENYKNTTKWSSHLKRWNIKLNKKFKYELKFFDYREQNIRILLYSNHLKLKKFCFHHKMYNIKDPRCTECSMNTEESLQHYLCECPRYQSQRELRDDQISKMYNIFNAEQSEDRFKIHWSRICMKGMLFPSFEMNMEDRIKIIRSTINYVITTNRFKDL